jgi:hypothetical protein
MEYRTFIKLNPYERWILRVLQNFPLMTGKKRKLPANRLIGAILREYFDDLVESSDPSMLRQLLKLGPPCPGELNDNVIRKLESTPRPGGTAGG